jgi:hypothetical protein
MTVLVRGRDAVLRLSTADLSVAMAELYHGIDIDNGDNPRAPDLERSGTSE